MIPYLLENNTTRLANVNQVKSVSIQSKNATVSNTNERKVSKRLHVLQETDRWKLGDLYTKYHRRIQAYIISLKVQKSVAECLTQDVFVQLCYDYANGRGIKCNKGYLFGLARHIVNEYRRGTSRLPIIPLSNVLENLVILSTEGRSTTQIEDKMDKTVFLQALDKAISGLPEKYREALEMRYTQNLSLSDAAQQAKCSQNTFYQRIYHAIKLVKAKINSHQIDS